MNEESDDFVALGCKDQIDVYIIGLQNIMRERGVWGIHPALIQGAVKNLCTLNQPEIDLCAYFIFSLIGEDREQHDLVSS